MEKLNSPFTFLKSAFNTLRSNEQIYYPVLILIFIQLFLLELMYFIPRFPLVTFFGPVIRRIWSEEFLHYPMNLILLPKIFYYAQMAVYLFIGSFLLAIATHIIASINNDEKVDFKISVRKTLPSYIHVLLASFLSLILFQAFNFAYGMIINRALKIRSENGIFFLLKKVVILGAPYVQFLVGIIITTLLVYIVPIIVIERKKIFGAIIGNFKMLFGSFWLTLMIVLVPTFFYIPVLLMRNNITFLAETTAPEIQVFVLVLGIIVMVAIDTVVLTAATTYYLFKKENS